MENKTRIQFDLTDQTLKDLDELQKQAGAKTRAELVRNALKFYDWGIQHKTAGKKIIAVKITTDDEYTI